MSWIKEVFVGLISLSFYFWPVWTKVTETTQSYTCTEDLHHVESEYAMKHPDCDQYWSAQDLSIGTFLKSTPECHSPCKELFVGRITMTECVNITLAVICTRDDLTEHRVHFYGRRVPQSLHKPAKRGHIGIFLSIALLVMPCITIACLLYAGCNQCTKILDEESLQ
ncbi:hypothetical protein R3I93_009292 [Phoxinus phoxinus]|uniref:Uncharacterized protein n=1 Tax=Phoxinus phoxinus TaxID=58324 RepID=A0AAN9H693_9TELE